MVKSSKKALAVLLAVACLITFMPAMASQSYAASKKAVKVTGTKTITAGKTTTLKANKKVKWTIKSGKKVVKLSSKKAKSVKVKGLKKGTAKVTATPATKALKKSYKAKTVTIKVKAKKAVEPEEALAIASSAQTGEKKLSVTFNKEIEDINTLKFAVAKGAVSQEITGTSLSSDKKTVELTLTAKITASDYTITVTPTEGDALTATVKGEVATLSDAKFLSENLVASDNTFKTATVVVKGYNQFGEEMTLSGSPNFTVSKGTAKYEAKTGVLTLTAPAGTPYVLNEKVAVNVVYANNTKAANATLTVSQAATVSSIEIGDITTDNTSLKSARLTSDNLSKGNYYVAVTAKDQYGDTLSASKLNAMVTAKTLYVTPDSTTASSAIAYAGSFEDKNGQAVLNIKAGSSAINYGTAVINILSVSGTTAQKTISVLEKEKVDTISYEDPALVAGKDVAFNLTATNQYGEAVDLYTAGVTKSTDSKSIYIGGTSTTITATNATFTVKKSNAKKTVTITIKADNDAKIVNITYLTAGFKSGANSYNVGAAATLAGIKGVNSKVNTELTAGQCAGLTDKTIVFLDSDGAEWTDADNLPTYSATEPTSATQNDPAYKYTVSVPEATKSTLDVDTTGDVKAGSSITEASSVNATITLYGKNTAGNAYEELDSKTVAFTVTPVANLDYAIKDIKTLSTVKANTTGIEFTLVGKNGDTEVPVDQSSLIADASTNVSGITVSDNKLVWNAPVDTKGTDATGTLTVLVGAGSKTVTVTKDFTYTNAASKATSIVLKDEKGNTVTDDEIAISASKISTLGGYQFYVADQFGNPYTTGVKATITSFTSDGKTAAGSTVEASVDSTTGKVTLSQKNGETVASGNTFNLTLMASGVTKTISVVVED